MAVEKTHKEVVWVVGRQVNMADVLWSNATINSQKVFVTTP